MHDSPAACSIRSWQRQFLLAVLCCTFAVATGVSAAEVWIVTDPHHPVTASPGARLIELDAPARIEAEISAGLPSNPAQARAIADQRLRDRGRGLQRRLASAYQGVVDAWSLGISKVPAVVVDKRFVVYGLPDANQALARIEQYRRHHP